MSTNDPRLLLLHPDDTVLVARRRIAAGETVTVEGVAATLAADLPIGHKLARRAAAPGEKVLKHGAPIGRASRPISVGEPVHTHNLVSDYTPTYTLDEAKAAARERSP